MQEATQAEGSERNGSPGTVIVTGGASGLGAAVVRGVVDAGGTPVVFDVQPPPSEVDHAVVDVSDASAVRDAVEDVVERHGRLDAAVTAAGIDAPGELSDVPAERWEKVIGVNLLGTAAVARAALPHLERASGRFVSVASTLGLRAVSDATAYCASKFGVVGFTRALAAETSGRVGVTLVLPGGMNTAFFDTRDDRYKPPPDLQLNRPEHVASAILFALSQPAGCEIRELVIAPSTETSWP
ncbi:MAG TPA: SDR family oxidoreductase [Acidimicrobiia bacterium]|nr:SDR family oxidoreductase [Acidimicrobiia bacterium]